MILYGCKVILTDKEASDLKKAVFSAVLTDLF